MTEPNHHKWICDTCRQEIPARVEDLESGEVCCAACEAKYDISPIRPPEETEPHDFESLMAKHGVSNRENQLRFRPKNRLFHYGLLLWLAVTAFFFEGGGLVLMWRGAFGEGGLDSVWNFLKSLLLGAVGFLFIWLGLLAIVGLYRGLLRVFGKTRIEVEDGRFVCDVHVGPLSFRQKTLPIDPGSKIGILLRHAQDGNGTEEWDKPVTECHLFLETDDEKINGRELWLPEEELPFVVAWLEKRREAG